ncbi:hypothetical protein [Streptomyces sp. NPDC050121]|uniref:hypothetical protein n=1 Tax=Streptomyces sp. NPDC050121 TaxID=3365601 RepID=UPI00378F766E
MLNSDPDARLRHRQAGSESLGSEVVILGTGNVSVDVARLLSKSDLDFIASDVDDDALRTVAPNPVRTIHILGRCDPHTAKWDASMVRELAEIAGVHLSVDGVPLIGEPSASPRTTVNVRFRRVPVSVRWHDGRVRVTTHRAGDSALVDHLDADTVITALGFAPLRRSRRGSVTSRLRTCSTWVAPLPAGWEIWPRTGSWRQTRRRASWSAFTVRNRCTVPAWPGSATGCRLRW